MADVMGKYVEAQAALKGEVLPSTVDQRADELAVQKAESDVTEQVRANALKASRVLSKLIDKAGDVQGQDATIQAVRAIADAQNKSVDALMKMTGRDHKPAEDDLVGMLSGMAAKGFLKMNVDVQVGGGGE